MPEFAKLCGHFADRTGLTRLTAWAITQNNLSRLTTFATCDEIQQAWEVAKAVGNDRYMPLAVRL